MIRVTSLSTTLSKVSENVAVNGCIKIGTVGKVLIFYGRQERPMVPSRILTREKVLFIYSLFIVTVFHFRFDSPLVAWFFPKIIVKIDCVVMKPSVKWVL